jgi:hypothetical protein
LLQQPLSIDCINPFACPAQSNNSGARFKIFPWTDNENGDFLLKQFSFFEERNCFSHSFLYYKEFSLRLLFPEHYFL